METLRVPSPGLNQTVLNTLALMEVWGDQPVSRTAEQLIAQLSEDEAAFVGESIGSVAALLIGDPIRLRLAMDLVVSLDIFEAIPALVGLARDTLNADVLLACAALSAHPGVNPNVADTVQMASAAASLDANEARLVRLRLDPTFAPTNDVERLQQRDAWAGKAGTDLPQVPVVIVHESSGAPKDAWRLAIYLRERGARIRRVPRRIQQAVPADWVPSDTPVVAQSWSDVVVLRDRGFELSPEQFVPAPSGSSRDRLEQLVRRVNQRLPGRARLRAEERLEVPSAADVLDPEVIVLGAFDTFEMAFLTGVRRNTARYLRNHEVLRPRRVGSLNYWSFSQLVGIRVWSYLRANIHPRLPSLVASQLTELAQSQEARIVGVTTSGEVFIRDNGRVVSAASGQTAPEELIALDKVFQPFEIGGGSYVPDLRRPSAHTEVHPARLRGTPVVEDTRISARSIYAVAQGAIRASADPLDRVRDAYPEVTQAQAQDARLVGSRVAGAA